ncbi:MAG: ferritin-like domain-containing protein [Chitinophagaceae bacterium]|nr:ferritin-like domain-containing protein [Chitinophagaceae bacterium]
MNLSNIIDEIEKADGEAFDRVNSRRSVLRNFAGVTGKAALAALPVAFGSLFKKAYAGTRGVQDVFDVLNYALTLEYLEAEFYVQSLLAPGLLSGQLAMSIQTISKHETAHVNFLKAAITAAGGTPVDKPGFDFSGGKGSGDGPFKNAFSDLGLFLAVAQAFEDTGVRAYKGRAAELLGGEAVTTAALQIHSVEARHAAHIRYMRQQLGSGVGNLQPWITGNMSGIDSELVQPSYNGEENTMQASVEITGINGFEISAESASEAFDEPLTPEQVLAIVDGFIV